MAVNIEFNEPIPTPTIGKAVCHTILFSGMEMDEGKGTVELRSMVRKCNPDGSYSYFQDTSTGIANISSRLVPIAEVLGREYRDGDGGVVTGMQILNGLAHMVEMAWDNEFTNMIAPR